MPTLLELLAYVPALSAIAALVGIPVSLARLRRKPKLSRRLADSLRIHDHFSTRINTQETSVLPALSVSDLIALRKEVATSIEDDTKKLAYMVPVLEAFPNLVIPWRKKVFNIVRAVGYVALASSTVAGIVIMLTFNPNPWRFWSFDWLYNVPSDIVPTWASVVFTAVLIGLPLSLYLLAYVGGRRPLYRSGFWVINIGAVQALASTILMYALHLIYSDVPLSQGGIAWMNDLPPALKKWLLPANYWLGVIFGFGIAVAIAIDRLRTLKAQLEQNGMDENEESLLIEGVEEVSFSQQQNAEGAWKTEVPLPRADENDLASRRSTTDPEGGAQTESDKGDGDLR
ncbi:hypothetical protein [Catellatospora methionotrophica]|uniref:hypothetical protein n=1 Tax=Catellatospora methionotrophica TaxID=121620 RepID=UPI0033E72498